MEKDPDNVKALFRRAQAYMMTQDYIEAKQDLSLAIKSEPANRLVFSYGILELANLFLLRVFLLVSRFSIASVSIIAMATPELTSPQVQRHL